jgi:hypothetical protein
MIDRQTLMIEARRFRTCPPPSVLNDPAHEDAVQEHIARCPDCELDALTGEEPETVWSEFLSDLQASRPPDLFPDPPPLSPGQFRSISSKMAHWADGRYFSPPLLLVLDLPDSPDGFVRALQTYHEPGLAGPGDLILENHRTGRGDLFVETWNPLHVSRDELGPAFGAVDAEALDAVRAMETDPAARPAWAPPTRPLQDNDPRLAFRRLEREVAEFFAAPVLVPHVGHGLLRLAHQTVRALRRALDSAIPELRWPEGPADLNALLAVVQSGPRPLAAADASPGKTQANLVILRDNQLSAFRPVPVESAEPVWMDGDLSFSGRVLELPERGRSSGILAFLKRPHFSQAPAAADWDAAEGRFYVEFENPPHPPGELALAVLWEEGE